MLEIGCGTGDLLAALGRPRRRRRHLPPDGRAARARHPGLEFVVGDVEPLAAHRDLRLRGPLGRRRPPRRRAARVRALRRVCAPHTRVIVTYYNFLWEPLLRAGERLGLKMPQPRAELARHGGHREPARARGLRDDPPRDTSLLLRSTCRCSRRWQPRPRPPAAAAPPRAGRRLRRPARRRCRSPESRAELLGHHPGPQREGQHRGRRSRARRRWGGTPSSSSSTGNSSDGTVEEIERVIAATPRARTSSSILPGRRRGKGDAVRRASPRPTGDVLMILDADLTVPPEDLPKFYDALADGPGRVHQRLAAWSTRWRSRRCAS